MRPRLSDIAQALGLNISTVSRALRGDPRVQEPTRLRIQAEAEAMGYRPHWTARALAEGRSRTLWFLLPELESPVEREPATFAGRWLLDRGYDLLLALHHRDSAVYSRIVDRLVQGGADGALILPGNPLQPSEADLRLAQEGFPVVYLDRSIPGLSASVVTSDNVTLAGGLVQRLIARTRSQGQSLAWLTDGFHAEKNSVEAARSRGVRAEAQRLGLPVVAPGDRPPGLGGWVSTGQTEAEAWLSMVGGQGSLGIFDGWAGRPPSEVPVVVAKQDFRTMAEKAAGLVLDWLAHGGPEPREILVAGQGYEDPKSLVPQ